MEKACALESDWNFSFKNRPFLPGLSRKNMTFYTKGQKGEEPGTPQALRLHFRAPARFTGP
jgi:hypothetical protein